MVYHIRAQTKGSCNTVRFCPNQDDWPQGTLSLRFICRRELRSASGGRTASAECGKHLLGAGRAMATSRLHGSLVYLMFVCGGREGGGVVCMLITGDCKGSHASGAKCFEPPWRGGCTRRTELAQSTLHGLRSGDFVFVFINAVLHV